MATMETASKNEKNRVRITALKAMQLKDQAQALIKVETDVGLIGFGEAGASGPMARAHLKHMEPLLIGRDPLEIEKLFNEMLALTHPYRAHLPTISGVDIALWDLAGKILNRSVSELLRGRMREWIPFYVGTPGPEDWFDQLACRDWSASVRAHPHGRRTLKLGFERLRGQGLSNNRYITGRPATTLSQAELKVIGRGYHNLRDALGDDLDFIVHCHNEWDLPTAIGLTEAVAGARPLWVEDPLPVHFSESWVTLKQKSSVRIKTGEKLEHARDFLPFLVHNAVDVIHLDLVFAGGFTGGRRIAELADLFSTPVVTHNVGSIVHNAASAHFGAVTRNFVMTETQLGLNPLLEAMCEQPFQIHNARMRVPNGPGLGINLRNDVLKTYLRDDEPFWD